MDYLLEKIDRNPLTFESEAAYCAYLGNARTPELFTDNKANLLEKLHTEFAGQSVSENSSIEELKDMLGDRGTSDAITISRTR